MKKFQRSRDKKIEFLIYIFENVNLILFRDKNNIIITLKRYYYRVVIKNGNRSFCESKGRRCENDFDA